MNNLYILYTKPPACVLFYQDNIKYPAFTDLETDVVPVFPIEGSITVKGYSVQRKQVPMCSVFSLTDYKIQGSILNIAILDLKNDPTAKGQNQYKKYCSLYIQLSRLRSLDSLYLLQKLDMEDLQFYPDDKLLAEIERLYKLEQKTMAVWEDS
jgi:hypothetical protein